MNTLQVQIDNLRRAVFTLQHWGEDNTEIYSDDLWRMSSELYVQTDALLPANGCCPEEEASLCLVLLMAYNAILHNDEQKQAKIQAVLDRCWEVLEHLPDSLLKCRLVVACYGESFDEELSQEAHLIIDSWAGHDLSEEEREVVMYLKDLEENPYPWSEVVE